MTNFGRSMGFDAATSAMLYKALESQSLLKRLGQPKDIANLAMFLASSDAENISGSIMLSDSGYLISAPDFKIEDLIKLRQNAAKTNSKMTVKRSQNRQRQSGVKN